MQVGLSWEYRVVTERSFGRETEYFQIENISSKTLDNGREVVRRSSDGTEYTVKETKQGVFRVAKRTIVELKPQPDDPPRPVMLLPLEQGTKWDLTTQTYVSERFEPFREPLQHRGGFGLIYEIEKTNASVEVPAGRFENCLLIVGKGKLRIYEGEVFEWLEIPVTTREWYAEGVGLVKLERSEVLSTNFFSGGTRIFELTRFER